MPRIKKDLESSFRTQLAVALKHFTDTGWLGKNSPLASPYFLGRPYLHRQPAQAATHAAGKALQSLLRHTCQVMAGRDEENARAYAQLLDLVYIQKRAPETSNWRSM